MFKIPAEVLSEEQTDVFEARNCLVDKGLDAGGCSERQGNLKWMAVDWASENTKWYISFDYKHEVYRLRQSFKKHQSNMQ